MKFRNFVLEANKIVDLDLEQFDIFDENTKFVAGTPAGGISVSAPDVVLLKGKISEDENSSVFLGLSPFGTNGMIRTGDEIYFVSPNKNSTQNGLISEAYVCNQRAVPAPSGPSRLCQTRYKSTYPYIERKENQTSFDSDIAFSYVVDAALDGAFSYFQLMDSNVQAALGYLVQLTAASSIIYERDFSAKFWLAFCRVWTVPDPFQNGGSIYDELDNFEEFWNDNMGQIHRNFASKIISNNRTGAVGLANVKELCNPGAAYSVCGLEDGSFPQPVTSGDAWWDLLIIAHEWGHTFGANHTHCYSPPLDSCYAEEDGCYRGEVRCRRGTIMSYCHVVCGGTGNVDPIFHPHQINEISLILRNISVPNLACVSRTLTPSYVHWGNHGEQDGSSRHPWDTVQEGARWVTPGGTVLISSGNYPETLKIVSRCTLQRNGRSGVVIIGQ
ncbi:MAG: M12 family metallo-peptidase [Nitrososphaera sp.]